MSTTETDVVEVKAANSFLPNLTISIEKDDENEESQVEFAEEDTNGVQKDESDMASQNKNSMRISLETKSFPHTKIYENKALKEMGLTPEEALLQREKRAKRFHSPLNRTEEEDGYQKVDEDIASSVIDKIKKSNETLSEDEVIRLDAVYLRGVNDLSTEDIFRYFSNFIPTHIEWINDTACNVSWKDETSAVNAYLSMTQSGKVKPKEDTDKTTESTERLEVDDDLDLLDSDTEEQMETQETDNQPKVSEENNSNPEKTVEKEAKQSQEQKDSDAVCLNELRRCKKPFVKDGRKHLLKMRLAAAGDKKILGGASKSEYYKKYGNPNYGNVRGLLTRSFMKRFHHREAKQELESFNIKLEYGDSDNTSKPVSKTNSKRKMMYSDKNWTKSKRKRKEDSASSEEDGEISSSEEDEQQKEDRDLMNSSAKDLSDAVPVRHRHAEKERGTMMADRIAEKVQNARRQNSRREKHSPERKKQNVWSRLGNRSNRTFTVKNDDGQRHREKHTREPDKRVLERLPASLRERLGTKNSDRHNNHHVHDRSRSSARHEDNRGRGDSARRRSLSESPKKEVKKERDLPRYSPPPWDDGDVMDQDCDEFVL